MPSVPTGLVPPKPQALVARKPRISRSRVIAQLGAQRSAASKVLAGSTPGRPSGSGRVRSSMGAGASRRSFAGVKAAARSSTGSELAAKKRVRQSEIAARRKNRAVVGSPSRNMDVDD